MTAGVAVRERPIPFSTEMVTAILDGRKSQTRRVVRSSRIAPLADAQAVETMSPGYFGFRSYAADAIDIEEANGAWVCGAPCPYGAPGDRLWVREAVWFWHEQVSYPNEDTDSAERWCEYEWAAFAENVRIGRRRDIVSGKVENITYLDATSPLDSHGYLATMRRRPTHLAPRWTSRITLEITSVRVERLQAITEADALAEGIERSDDPGLRSWPFLGPTHPIKGTPKVFATAVRAYESLWDSLNAKRGFGWDVNPWVWVIEFTRVHP